MLVTLVGSARPAFTKSSYLPAVTLNPSLPLRFLILIYWTMKAPSWPALLANWRVGNSGALAAAGPYTVLHRDGKRFPVVGIPASESENPRGLVRDTPKPSFPPHLAPLIFQRLRQQNFSDRKKKKRSRARLRTPSTSISPFAFI